MTRKTKNSLIRKACYVAFAVCLTGIFTLAGVGLTSAVVATGIYFAVTSI